SGVRMPLRFGRALFAVALAACSSSRVRQPEVVAATDSMAAGPMTAPAPMPRRGQLAVAASPPNSAARAKDVKRAENSVAAVSTDTVPFNTEGYDVIAENPFLATASAPRSTFSIDVDHASYSNVRRFLTEGNRPPRDAVRLEELLNYFPYDLPAPVGDDPV